MLRHNQDGASSDFDRFGLPSFIRRRVHLARVSAADQIRARHRI
jgi:hypothetical protein